VTDYGDFLRAAVAAARAGAAHIRGAERPAPSAWDLKGAADFVSKPISMSQLMVRLENVCSIRHLRKENVRLQEELEKRYSFSKIVGKSKQMQQLFDLIKVVASSDASVLIHGESGTGKEMVANAIHYNSRRRKGPYVRVSCTALPETLIESELFGSEKGAFTGASQRRIGRFEASNGGTLFLDEIGELPLPFQVKLLRVLQERQIERLGSNSPIDVDVRILSASLRPLEEEIADGRFREDLYFRVNTVAIHVPPLRDRREDVALLAQTFLQEFVKDGDKEIAGFSDEVLYLFDTYPWPGNVRELRNVVERAVLFCRGSRITVEELPAPLRGVAGTQPEDTIRAEFTGSTGARGSAGAALPPLESSAARQSLTSPALHAQTAKLQPVTRIALRPASRCLHGYQYPRCSYQPAQDSYTLACLTTDPAE